MFQKDFLVQTHIESYEDKQKNSNTGAISYSRLSVFFSYKTPDAFLYRTPSWIDEYGNILIDSEEAESLVV